MGFLSNEDKIAAEYGSPSIQVQADEYRISQVFINLINNAVNFHRRRRYYSFRRVGFGGTSRGSGLRV